MKKNEFFAAMKNVLSGMDEELVADILNDYEIHFKEGMENGKTEEEICEELGNVEEIKQAFLEENPNYAVARPVVDLGETAQDHTTETAKTAIEIFDKNSADLFNREYPGIQRVFAQLISADIKISKSNTNSVGVSVTGKRAEDVEALKETLHITASAGTLTLRQEKKMQIASHGMSWLFGGSFGIFRSENLCIHIELPEAFLQAQIKNISGDIAIDYADCENLTVETVSGDIAIGKIRAIQCELQTKSGNAIVKDSNLDNLLIRTISGDAQIESCKAEQLDVASTSGDVKTILDENRQCKLKSTSGDCSVTIGNYVEAEITTTSGDVSVHYLGGRGLEMALSTVSGDVSASCGGVHYGGKKKVSASYGEPDSKVKASTVSGDLTVRDR